MEATRRQMTNVAAGVRPGYGPPNTLSHIRQFPDAEFRSVVRPNFDTLYSTAALDLTEEPVVVSVPEVGDRYYLLPMYDMLTDAFAAPGKPHDRPPRGALRGGHTRLAGRRCPRASR